MLGVPKYRHKDDPSLTWSGRGEKKSVSVSLGHQSR
ncbi:H-NS family nucleoid-associated regulatory protein [Fluviibacter phosphoraccumulans]